MKRPLALLTAMVALGTTLAITEHLALAQPSRGAAAAFERVREVMTNRFKDMKLAGDPDKDFAALLIAHHEDLIFLAKTQLEHGGDRRLRQLAEKILDEPQKQTSEVKEWQLRSRQTDYKAQPDQPPPGSIPLDQKSAPTTSATPSPTPIPAQPTPATNLPMISGTVEKIDTPSGKITIDHSPIPNLNMDAMTMVFRAQDPGLLKGVKTGDKVQFQADRVNGQISIVKIQKSR